MPSPKALEHLKDTYKDEQPLLPALQRHILKKVAQEESDRRTDILHPSAMSSKEWCSRHDYYGIIGAAKSKDKGGSSTFRRELIYEYGHSIHRKYQTWLWEMGLLWGKWKCNDCGFEWLDLAPDRCAIDTCDSSALTYEEVPFELPDLALGGHADGLVMEHDANRLIEIKSIGIGSLRFDSPTLYDQYQNQDISLDQVWYRIQRPFGKHLRQGLIYVAETKLMYPELNVDEIVFIYEWKPNQDTKSFTVRYTPSIVEPLLDQARLVAERAKLFSEQHVVDPPPRPEWAEGATGKVCKSCDYRGTCWGDDPGTEDPAPPTGVRVRRATAKRRPKAR